jgi:hypothetical protein
MLTPPLLLADYAGYVDVSDRSAVGAATNVQLTAPGPQPAGLGGPQFGVDAFTQGQLRVRMTNRRVEWTLAYLPSLTFTNLQLGTGADPLLLMHAGHVGVAWLADRGVTVTVAEDATYGRFNSANVLAIGVGAPVAAATPPPPAPTPAGGAATPATGTAPPPPAAPMTGANLPPLQQAPPPKTINMVSTKTAAEVGAPIERHTHFTVGAAYFATGALGDTGTLQLPLQYGPSATVGVEHALSRRDTMVTKVLASSTQFTSLPCVQLTGVVTTALCRPVYELLQVGQGFQHMIDRTTAVTAQLGVTYTRIRNDTSQPFRPVWFPTGLLGVMHKSGERGAVLTEVDLSLVPVINTFTGTLTNYLQAQALLTEPVVTRVVLHATAGGAQTLPADGPAAATIIQGGLEFDYLVNKQLDLAVGERVFWQRQALAANLAANGGVLNANTPPTVLGFGDFFSTVAYFAVTVRAPELRF